MNQLYTILLAAGCLVMSCRKSATPVPDAQPLPAAPPTDTVVVVAPPVPVDSTVTPPADSFTTYIVPKGANYCIGNRYPPGEYTGMRFRAVFDSSCIYRNADPANQADINKLMGFADNRGHHQENSARFGWNWYDGALRIHAYCYVNGARQSRELGTVAIGAVGEYKIEVLPGAYVFTLNGKSETVQRGTAAPTAIGYKLYPYFGGDEPAPQEVRIRVMEY